MAEPNESPNELPDWIKDHLARYIATDGEDGYLWDASVGGGKGMVPTLLLTTIGRKSGKALTLPLIFGLSGASYVVIASKGGAAGTSGLVLESAGQPRGPGTGQGQEVHRSCIHCRRRGEGGVVGEDGGRLRAL